MWIDLDEDLYDNHNAGGLSGIQIITVLSKQQVYSLYCVIGHTGIFDLNNPKLSRSCLEAQK